jgi:hypothetical protein
LDGLAFLSLAANQEARAVPPQALAATNHRNSLLFNEKKNKKAAPIQRRLTRERLIVKIPDIWRPGRNPNVGQLLNSPLDRLQGSFCGTPLTPGAERPNSC